MRTAPALFVSLAMLPAAGARAGTAAIATLNVASGLNRPVFVTHAPGDATRLYIVEQRGVIKVLDLTTRTVSGTPFLDIDSLVAGPSNSFDERGLLGLAFDPDFESNGYFYVNYTNNASDTQVSRYTALSPDVADSGSALRILNIDQPQSNHNGGWMGFGPNDGYLYIATGDGGNFCDTGSGHTTTLGNAQDITNNLLGKMLRIDPDSDDFPGDPTKNYAIPADNPFVGITGDDEIWAYGLRNPWRSSFDRANGDLYIGDVGQDAREEIDYQDAASAGGENYGWRCFEGLNCSNISGCSTQPCNCDPTGITMPVQVYTHLLGFSVTGGYVYRGCAIPSYDGLYFYADFGTGRVWTFEIVGGVAMNNTERTGEITPSLGGVTVNQIASFGEDASGELYIVDRGGTSTGGVFRIVPVNKLADFDCDLVVGILDFLELLSNWGPCDAPSNCPWDLDRSGDVGINDFLETLAQWGPVG